MFGDKKHPPQKRIDCLIGAGTTVRGLSLIHISEPTRPY